MEAAQILRNCNITSSIELQDISPRASPPMKQWHKLITLYTTCNYDSHYRTRHDPSLPFPHLKLEFTDSHSHRKPLNSLPARIQLLRSYIFPEFRLLYSQVLSEPFISELLARNPPVWELFIKIRLQPDNTTVKFLACTDFVAEEFEYIPYTLSPTQIEFLHSFRLNPRIKSAIDHFEHRSFSPTFYNLFYPSTPCAAELLLELCRNSRLLLSKLPLCEDLETLILKLAGLL